MSADRVVVRTAEVVATRPVGAYELVSLALPGGLAGHPAPGQFLVLPPAEPAHGQRVQTFPDTAWVAGVRQDPVLGVTVETVLVAAAAPEQRTSVRVLGPTGRGFPLPTEPLPALLVAHELAAAPMLWLARLLRERGAAVHLVLTADDEDAHLDIAQARRVATTLHLGRPSDVEALADRALPTTGAGVGYAAGPAELTGAVARACARHGVPARVSAIDLAAGSWCGIGLCGRCEREVATTRGPRRVRPCVDGPVLPGEVVLR